MHSDLSVRCSSPRMSSSTFGEVGSGVRLGEFFRNPSHIVVWLRGLPDGPSS